MPGTMSSKRKNFKWMCPLLLPKRRRPLAYRCQIPTLASTVTALMSISGRGYYPWGKNVPGLGVTADVSGSGRVGLVMSVVCPIYARSVAKLRLR